MFIRGALCTQLVKLLYVVNRALTTQLPVIKILMDTSVSSGNVGPACLPSLQKGSLAARTPWSPVLYRPLHPAGRTQVHCFPMGARRAAPSSPQPWVSSPVSARCGPHRWSHFHASGLASESSRSQAHHRPHLPSLCCCCYTYIQGCMQSPKRLERALAIHICVAEHEPFRVCKEDTRWPGIKQ